MPPASTTATRHRTTGLGSRTKKASYSPSSRMNRTSEVVAMIRAGEDPAQPASAAPHLRGGHAAPATFGRRCFTPLPIECVPDADLESMMQPRSSSPSYDRNRGGGGGLRSTSPPQHLPPRAATTSPRTTTGTASSPSFARQLMTMRPGTSASSMAMDGPASPAATFAGSTGGVLDGSVAWDTGVAPPPSGGATRRGGGAVSFGASGRRIPLNPATTSEFDGGGDVGGQQQQRVTTAGSTSHYRHQSTVVDGGVTETSLAGLMPLAMQSSDADALLASPRAVASRVGREEREVSAGGGLGVDRRALFSRERLQAQDRRALRSRAKTPLEIEQWQARLPLPHIREVIRGRKKVTPATELEQRRVERCHKMTEEHLEREGIRYHTTRSRSPANRNSGISPTNDDFDFGDDAPKADAPAWRLTPEDTGPADATGDLLTVLGAEHKAAEERLAAERKRRQAPLRKAPGKRAVHNVMRTIAAARLASGAPVAPATPASATPGGAGDGPTNATSLRRPSQEAGGDLAARSTHAPNRPGSSSTLRRDAARLDDDLAGDEAAGIIPQRPPRAAVGTPCSSSAASVTRLSESETVALINEWNRMDELNRGAVNVRDVAWWVREVFTHRPVLTVAVQQQVLDAESGIVMLPRYCELVCPGTSRVDIAVSLQVALARKPHQRSQRKGGANGDGGRQQQAAATTSSSSKPATAGLNTSTGGGGGKPPLPASSSSSSSTGQQRLPAPLGAHLLMDEGVPINVSTSSPNNAAAAAAPSPDSTTTTKRSPPATRRAAASRSSPGSSGKGDSSTTTTIAATGGDGSPLAAGASSSTSSSPPPIVDCRAWMAAADPGIVATLRDMYLAQRTGLRGVSQAHYVKRFARLRTREELEEAFAAADVDGDGYLCFEEFARLLWPGVAPGTLFPGDCTSSSHHCKGC